MFALYPFQNRMVKGKGKGLYGAIKAGHRVILMVSATGTGKTTVAGYVTADLLSRNGARCLFIVDRLELAEQSRDVFADRFRFPSSVWQGKHPDYRADAPIQVAMHQTLTRRREELLAWVRSSDASLLVWWDEAHETAWTAFAKWLMAETRDMPNVVHILLTATPDRTKPTEGFGNICQSMVVGLTPREAMEHDPRYLVRDRYVDIPLDDQTSRGLLAMPIDAKTGDWAEGQLGELMSSPPTDRTPVAHALEHTPGRVGIAYGVNVRHAEALNAEFRRVGIRSAVISGDSSKAERKLAFDSLSSGRLQWLCNCTIAVKGLDKPIVSAIMVSRPTQSSALWFQCIGRGLRLDPEDPGKQDCIVLDQGANVARHGRAFDYGPYELICGRKPGEKKEPGADPPEPWICLHCRGENPPQLNACKHCGERKPVKNGADFAIEFPTEDGYISPIGAKLSSVPAKIEWVSSDATRRFVKFRIRHPANKRWYVATGILGNAQMSVSRGDWIRLSGKVKAHDPKGKYEQSSQIVSVEIAPDMTFLESK